MKKILSKISGYFELIHIKIANSIWENYLEKRLKIEYEGQTKEAIVLNLKGKNELKVDSITFNEESNELFADLSFYELTLFFIGNECIKVVVFPLTLDEYLPMSLKLFLQYIRKSIVVFLSEIWSLRKKKNNTIPTV